jgi:hypothetical protein
LSYELHGFLYSWYEVNLNANFEVEESKCVIFSILDPTMACVSSS